MKSRLKRVRGLAAEEWLLLARAWGLLLLFDLGLRLLPYPRVAGWAQPVIRHDRLDFNARIVSRTNWAVRQAARYHLYPMTCLRRSLTLQRLLNQQGMNADLRFGVIRSPDGLQAHAWVEHRGRPISEPEVLVGKFATLEPPER